MNEVSISKGRRFEAGDGEPLLDAALRADVALAYSCRNGRCGTCKGRVRNGETTVLHAETGLTAAEQAAGWILTCVRSVNSNVELDIEDLGDMRLIHAKTLPCRIQALERVTADVVRVVLRLPPTCGFDFHCGQYIDVIGHAGLRRSYSIASAPRADQHIELHIRHVPGGAMSRYWFDEAKVNDLLRINGPLGTFFLREVEGLDLVFLATGTGIAPVKSVLEGLAALPVPHRARSITVVWGGRVEADLYWDVRTAGVDLAFVPVLSRASMHWDGARGHVQQALLAQARDWQWTAVYACGSEGMIHSARHALLDAGLAERRFLSDAFVCSAAAA